MGVPKRKDSVGLVGENPGVQRGSIVSLRRPLHGCSYGVVVSNNLQNEHSQYLLAVPLEKRRSRLKAPFAVDIGRSEGLRALHCARCDWVTRTPAANVKSIERACVAPELLAQVDSALCIALGIPE